MKTIPIFFTIDEGYAPYLGVLLDSLITNASKNYNYDINIIHEPLKDETKEKLKKLERDNFKIKFYQMDRTLDVIKDEMGNRLRADYFTLTIYYRIFIADIFKEYDKGIYLDSDIIVNSDISELFNYDLEDNLLGAINDESVSGNPDLAYYMEEGVGVNRNRYINSGVLLMNLKKLREVEFDKHFLYLFSKYHFDTVAPDQDYINAMCKDRILYLPWAWDAMPIEGIKEIENPKLIHYNLFMKPWCYDDIPYEKYFWKYAEKSDFYDEILKSKKSFSSVDMENDSKHLELLITRAKQIPDNDITFKKIFENGKEKRL